MSQRQQRKLEKKRQKRTQSKQREAAKLARRPDAAGRLIASASKAAFGPCAISHGWDEQESAPALVTLAVTRVLGNGLLLPTLTLVDRTCLGIKNGFTADPLSESMLRAELDSYYRAHGGWQFCDPLVVQSILFHALDYAARFGFKPHPDAAIELFGPRPETLLETPWHARERPLYMVGPHDNPVVVVERLRDALGDDGFDLVFSDGKQLFGYEHDDEDDEPFAELALSASEDSEPRAQARSDER